MTVTADPTLVDADLAADTPQPAEATEQDRDLQAVAALLAQENSSEEEVFAGDDRSALDPWRSLRQRVQRAHDFMTSGFA
jgi:hypothetical protein